MDELSLADGSSNPPPTGFASWSDVYQQLEQTCPKLTSVFSPEVLTGPDRQYTTGVYAVPNCPGTLDATTAITAYQCAVSRYGGAADRVKQTKDATKRLLAFVESFRTSGGVSLYHWAFIEVYNRCRNKPFTLKWKGNAGMLEVYSVANITPWALHKMFKQFPSTPNVCLRPVSSVLEYRTKQERALTEALQKTLETNQVQAGIQHIQQALPLEELRQRATSWMSTAKRVEASLQTRIAAGEDVWQGIFPGLER